MTKLFGYVLAKDTNAGVPNLVVSAYDADDSVDGLGDASAVQEMASARGNFGNRIGSVLTDHDGWFELESEELDYPDRPVPSDLLVVVFAPEDVQDVHRPYPLPPEERILYISACPRRE